MLRQARAKNLTEAPAARTSGTPYPHCGVVGAVGGHTRCWAQFGKPAAETEGIMTWTGGTINTTCSTKTLRFILHAHALKHEFAAEPSMASNCTSSRLRYPAPLNKDAEHKGNK